MQDLLWVALEHLEGLFESFDDFIECPASLCDVLRLTQGVQDSLILVNLLVQLSLEFVLRHAD